RSRPSMRWGPAGRGAQGGPSPVVLDEAVLVDAPADALAHAVAGDAVLQHGPPHPGGAVGDDLLALDAVLAAVLVGQVRGHTDLPRAAFHGARLELALLEGEQVPARPPAGGAGEMCWSASSSRPSHRQPMRTSSCSPRWIFTALNQKSDPNSPDR